MNTFEGTTRAEWGANQIEPARNYGRAMSYFIPDWDDLVDPHYDFTTDRPTPDRQKHTDEVYAHQIYRAPNYDGLVVSRSALRGKQWKIAQIQAQGIHDYTRFQGPVIGDCGAFSYIAEKNPPYEASDILTYYQDMGFDYGVSIDHLIVPAFYHEKEYRYQLTRQNAYEFLQQHRAGNYRFIPIGVAQGWSPESYRDAVIELIEWGIYLYRARRTGTGNDRRNFADSQGCCACPDADGLICIYSASRATEKATRWPFFVAWV